MKLLIGNDPESVEQYEVGEALDNARLGDLDDLQSSTRSEGFDGISVPWIRRVFRTVDPKKSAESLDYRRAVMAIVFLCKRRAGEDFSWEQAREVEVSSIRWVLSPEEIEAAKTPKASAATSAAES